MAKPLSTPFLALFLVLPGVLMADAAPPVRTPVGDSLLDGARLQPYANQWNMDMTKDGVENPHAGIWKDKLELVQFAGRDCWKRTQDATFTKKDGSVAANNITTNIFDRKTMAPLYREFRSTRPGQPAQDVRITMSGGAMQIESTSAGNTTRRKVKVQPAFDYDGGLYAVLWSAYPLKPGFSASFPSYSEGSAPETVSWRNFKVTGHESIQEPGLGTVDALVVEGDSESGPLKYWLITKPPFVLRMDYQAGNGVHWLLDMV